MEEKKNIIFIAAACFVLILSGVVAYMFLFSGSARTNKLLKTAEQYLSEEDYDEAITCYEKALLIKDNNEKAHDGIVNTYSVWADSLVSEGKTSSAIRVLENAVENNKYVKDDQRLMAKINEYKVSIVANKPQEEVVEEEPEEPEEPEETFDFDLSINESDFDFSLFDKKITEWNLESIQAFAMNDPSMYLARTEKNEKIYMNNENTLEVVLPDDGESVRVNDKDNYLVFSKTDYEGYTNSCLLSHYPNHKPSLGNVFQVPGIMGETIVNYLAGYSTELNDYILDNSINRSLPTTLRNAVLSTSEWVRDDTSAEIRGLKINFGTFMVNLHHSDHIAIDYIKYFY